MRNKNVDKDLSSMEQGGRGITLLFLVLNVLIVQGNGKSGVGTKKDFFQSKNKIYKSVKVHMLDRVHQFGD